MSVPTIEREDGGPDEYRCANCDTVYPFDSLNPIQSFHERVEAGGEVPAGECPDDDCGALCYPTKLMSVEHAPERFVINMDDERAAARIDPQGIVWQGIHWPDVDAIEVATVGLDREQPDAVTRIDGEDASGYRIVAHSVYVHRHGVGATCVCDCWVRDIAQQIGRALAEQLGVPIDDYTVDAAVEVTR